MYTSRHPRPKTLNKITHRALTLKPIDLSRYDGKRPDGITLIPWSKGQRLVWDVTCVITMATSYLYKTINTSGTATENACKGKHRKYKKNLWSRISYSLVFSISNHL